MEVTFNPAHAGLFEASLLLHVSGKQDGRDEQPPQTCALRATCAPLEVIGAITIDASL